MIAVRVVFTARASGETGLWKVIVSRRKWSSLQGRAILRREVMRSSMEHLGGTGAPVFPSHFTDGEILVDMRSTDTNTSLACSKPQALSSPPWTDLALLIWESQGNGSFRSRLKVLVKGGGRAGRDKLSTPTALSGNAQGGLSCRGLV